MDFTVNFTVIRPVLQFRARARTQNYGQLTEILQIRNWEKPRRGRRSSRVCRDSREPCPLGASLQTAPQTDAYLPHTRRAAPAQSMATMRALSGLCLLWASVVRANDDNHMVRRRRVPPPRRRPPPPHAVAARAPHAARNKFLPACGPPPTVHAEREGEPLGEQSRAVPQPAGDLRVLLAALLPGEQRVEPEHRTDALGHHRHETKKALSAGPLTLPEDGAFRERRHHAIRRCCCRASRHRRRHNDHHHRCRHQHPPPTAPANSPTRPSSPPGSPSLASRRRRRR